MLKGKSKEKRPDPLMIASHIPMEEHLEGYAGLVRYMKEMDETRYGKLCGVCSSMSDSRDTDLDI